jgi:hypothetical protein
VGGTLFSLLMLWLFRPLPAKNEMPR